MAKVYKSLCHERDLLLLKITNLAEKVIRYKVEMEKLMNRGFVDIAKARYIMGSTCVTKMQLPSEKSNPIQPVATICRAPVDNHWVYKVHRKDIPKNSNPVKKNHSSNGEKEEVEDGDDDDDDDEESKLVTFSETGFKNVMVNDPKSLRKSKNAYFVDDNAYQEYNDELLDEFSNHSGSTESLHSLDDPLRLFGILVPSTLKNAQETFKEVVGLLGKCATLQSQLREALSKYHHLNRVKKIVEIAAAEYNLNITKPKVYWTISEGSTPRTSETETEEEHDDVNVTKTIRSVFYTNPEEAEISVWSSESSEETEKSPGKN